MAEKNAPFASSQIFFFSGLDALAFIHLKIIMLGCNMCSKK
jgi:hypothetical protein